MQHPDDGRVVEQRHADHPADAVPEQDRVDHVGGVDVRDHHRLSGRGHPAGESGAERNANALPDLVLQPLGGDRGEECAGVIHQQDRRGVDTEQFAHPGQQLVEQFFEGELRQCHVGDRLDPAQLLVDVTEGSSSAVDSHDVDPTDAARSRLRSNMSLPQVRCRRSDRGDSLEDARARRFGAGGTNSRCQADRGGGHYARVH